MGLLDMYRDALTPNNNIALDMWISPTNRLIHISKRTITSFLQNTFILLLSMWSLISPHQYTKQRLIHLISSRFVWHIGYPAKLTGAGGRVVSARTTKGRSKIKTMLAMNCCDRLQPRVHLHE